MEHSPGNLGAASMILVRPALRVLFIGSIWASSGIDRVIWLSPSGGLWFRYNRNHVNIHLV
jgi:hypothetical protein